MPNTYDMDVTPLPGWKRGDPFIITSLRSSNGKPVLENSRGKIEIDITTNSGSAHHEFILPNPHNETDKIRFLNGGKPIGEVYIGELHGKAIDALSGYIHAGLAETLQGRDFATFAADDTREKMEYAKQQYEERMKHRGEHRDGSGSQPDSGQMCPSPPPPNGPPPARRR